MTPMTRTDNHPNPSRGPAFATVDPSCLVAPSYAEALVEPGRVFDHPGEVAEHPWFSNEEKRTVLLSWARDELVLEQVANRSLPELKPRSRINAVIEALAQFDPHAAAEYRVAVAAIRSQPLRRSSAGSGLKGPVKTDERRREVPCRSV